MTGFFTDEAMIQATFVTLIFRFTALDCVLISPI